MWKKLKGVLTGPELPTTPMLLSVPTQGPFGTARLTARWFPRSLTVEVEGASPLTLTDASLPRRLATSVAPPKVLASNPDEVGLFVADQPAAIFAGKRGNRRSSYVCVAFVTGVEYRLVPTGPKRAKLLAAGVVVGEFETSRVNHPPEAMSWAPTATPQDVSVGVLLSSTLGVGAYGFIRNFFRDFDFIPTP